MHREMEQANTLDVGPIELQYVNHIRLTNHDKTRHARNALRANLAMQNAADRKSSTIS
jgi:hypothetical protein